MVLGKIEKSDLKKLVDAIGNDGVFYGPVRQDREVAFSRVGPKDTIELDYYNFKLPPKNLFFAKSEVLFTYEEGTMSEAAPSTVRSVLFGVRPCDSISFLYLDRVFMDENIPDPYYESRRKNAVTIALACREPRTACFCTSVGGNPAGREGADVLASLSEDSLLFEACSEKGRTFMENYSSFFQKTNRDDIKIREEQSKGAGKKVRETDIAGITEKLAGLFESPVWEEISRRCIGCGVCTYLCPTCHCFGLYDEKYGSKGTRIRVQDSCMFPFFVLEASGYNPRDLNWKRMRQRVMHKFYTTVENFKSIYCVGCGRCITACPVNMDIRETLREIAT